MQVISNHLVGYSDKIEPEALQALFNEEILVLCVNNFINYPNENDIYARIYQSQKGSYEYQSNVVSHIGQSSYEIDDDTERYQTYYQNVVKNAKNLMQIFSPNKTPVEFFLEKIEQIWPAGIQIDKIHSQEMFAGIIRIIHQGSTIHAHQDLIEWSNKKAVNKCDMVRQFGVNYFIRVPEVGGELCMWNKELSYEEFHQASEGIFCIPINKMPTPDIVVKPAKCMLTFLNSKKLHAIQASQSCDRIALSFFLGYKGNANALSIWS